MSSHHLVGLMSQCAVGISSLVFIEGQASSAAGYAQTVKPVVTILTPSFPHLHPQPHTPKDAKSEKIKTSYDKKNQNVTETVKR